MALLPNRLQNLRKKSHEAVNLDGIGTRRLHTIRHFSWLQVGVFRTLIFFPYYHEFKLISHKWRWTSNEKYLQQLDSSDETTGNECHHSVLEQFYDKIMLPAMDQVAPELRHKFPCCFRLLKRGPIQGGNDWSFERHVSTTLIRSLIPVMHSIIELDAGLAPFRGFFSTLMHSI